MRCGAPWRRCGGLAERLVVLGGGGYNPYALARCWAGIWAVLNDIAIPDVLPAAAQAVLREVAYFRPAGRNPPAHWIETLRDAPLEGPVRDEGEAAGGTGALRGMRRWVLAMAAAMAMAGVARAEDATGPQPKLPTETLTIISDDGKSHPFTVEVAATEQQQDTGADVSADRAGRHRDAVSLAAAAGFGHVDEEYDRAAGHGVHRRRRDREGDRPRTPCAL